MPRGNPHPHRYKEGKVENVITDTDFLLMLKTAKQLEKERKNRVVIVKPCKDISVSGLIAIMYWTGLRVSEITGDPPHKYMTKKKGIVESEEIKGLRREDFDVIGNYLLVDVKEARKHGKREEPIWLPLDKPGVANIREAWKKTEKGKRVFPISKVTAWRLVKKINPHLYPHFFRLNRATNFARDPRTSVLDLKKWFAWVDARTIEKYMGKAGRTTRKMAERL